MPGLEWVGGPVDHYYCRPGDLSIDHKAGPNNFQNRVIRGLRIISDIADLMPGVVEFLLVI